MNTRIVTHADAARAGAEMPMRLVWTLYALILIAAPLVFGQAASLSILSQIGTMMIFALSYNMLLGQGGMLSFGHAVYSGLGAFAAAHAMNFAAVGQIWLPVMLVPLVGGLAGMGCGILLGYVTTKKSGTTFAMITLGIVELVAVGSLMFPEFFGGEGGISTNRVYGSSVFGISYGPQVQVYYLIALWLFLSTIGMYAFTKTPLGRILNAVRDNPERAEFIGYDAHWVRYLSLICAGFFAGISGGLSAINFEIVTAENLGVLRSGSVLLFTVIGGTGYFFGPMLGAIAGVFFTIMLSDFTKAWQLYLGIFFIVIVMYAPGGLAGILAQQMQLVKFGCFGRVWRYLWRLCALAVTGIAGALMLIEMLYHFSQESADGTRMRLAGFVIDTSAPYGWLAGAVLLAIGCIGFRLMKPGFASVWNEVNTDIERMMRSGE